MAHSLVGKTIWRNSGEKSQGVEGNRTINRNKISDRAEERVQQSRRPACEDTGEPHSMSRSGDHKGK